MNSNGIMPRKVPSFRVVVWPAYALAIIVLVLFAIGSISFTVLHVMGSIIIVIAFFMFAEAVRELYIELLSGPEVRSYPDQNYALILIVVVCPVVIFVALKLLF